MLQRKALSRPMPKYKRYKRHSRTPFWKSPMMKTSYGKCITTKLSAYSTMIANAAGVFSTVYPLYSTLALSNDFTNFETSFGLMNIIQCTVHILPGGYASTLGHTLDLGVCYDPASSTALTSYSQVCDHLQFKYTTFGNNAPTEQIFSIKPRPLGYIPQKTSDGTESWGYIKFYSTDTEIESAAIGSLVFTFTVVFSSQQ